MTERYECDLILACGFLQTRVVIKHVQFGTDENHHYVFRLLTKHHVDQMKSLREYCSTAQENGRNADFLLGLGYGLKNLFLHVLGHDKRLSNFSHVDETQHWDCYIEIL